ncbi:MAG: M24 family metallopeptidase [Candidatus Competibacterales bacterium]
MGLPFTVAEYRTRLDKVRQRMADRGIDLLLVSEPSNIYWLTGIGDWSFYVPQFALIRGDETQPWWIGRAMDAPGARLSGWMDDDRVIAYPEYYIHRPRTHPSDAIGAVMVDRGWGGLRIGYESDSYYFSPKSLAHLQKALPNATFVDGDLLVNWARATKSEAELAYMRQAATIVAGAMAVAQEHIKPGVRQCDAVGEIYKAQIAPAEPYGGDFAALCPMILVGEKASTAHPIWSDAPFEGDQTVAVELAGSRKHYNCALARTLHLGANPPAPLVDTAKAVEEGLEAVLATLKAGVTGHEAHAAWNAVLARHGLTKESRIGYAIGVGFPPDWGEHTISLRAGEIHPLETDTTLHIMLGMWMDGWGMAMSETVRITPTGVECLTQFPRELHVKGR